MLEQGGPAAAPKAADLWSLKPVADSAPPAVKAARWPTRPLDRFILAGLEAKGLTTAPPADRRTLVRRVTFDLTGLPPSPEEVADFLADRSTGACERVVDRLLDSPRYGEHWAQHWLDVVRYAPDALLMGAVCGHAEGAAYQALSDYGAAMGLAFQVVDDILDVVADSATLGKTAGKDAAADKPTYVSLLGLAEAQALAARLHAQAHHALDASGLTTAALLRSLADRVVMREN